jgi:hypothetical protein
MLREPDGRFRQRIGRSPVESVAGRSCRGKLLLGTSYFYLGGQLHSYTSPARECKKIYVEICIQKSEDFGAA